MGSRTTSRSARKRSPSDDEVSPVKRRRSDEGVAKKNNRVPLTDGRNLGSPLANRNINKKGQAAAAGIIQRIYVENFMCHQKFGIDLCGNVNFIHGQNGSGKSAILAAIQICLGAGARRTHRASNLKELVRKGANCNAAKIRVTLLNRGTDGFQPDVYGDSITVERTIAVRGGYNGYKLYDQNMEEQSRSKKDLDEMLDKLNIQVENPVAILDQEEAKKFLTGKDEDKYSFFMKATELERMDRNYANAMDQVVDLEKQSLRLNDQLDGYIDEMNEAKKKVQELEAIGKLKRKLSQYQEMFAWSLYKEGDQTLAVKKDERDKFQSKAVKKMDELTQAEEAVQGPDEEDTRLRNYLAELTEEANQQVDIKKSLEVQLKKKLEPVKSLQRQLKHAKKEQKGAMASLHRANRDLEEKRAEIFAKAGSAESEESQRTQRLQDAETDLAKAQKGRSQIKQDTEDAFKAYDELEPLVGQAKQDSQVAKKRFSGLQSRIRELESTSSNSLNIFGQNCGKVKQLVDRQNRFRGPVLGPIGSFVKIAAGKDQFASVAEFALGNGTLDRFIVTNDHDRKLLQGIRNRAGCRQDCGILQIHEHAKYEIPSPPVEGIETVASVLQIANDLVFNCLVDHCKIEEKALSTSKNESEDLLLMRGNDGKHSIRGKIKNVYFLPQGDNWTMKNGTIGLSSNEKRLKKTIGVDKSAALAENRHEAQVLKEEMDALGREENRLEHEHTKQQKVWNVKKKELRKNQVVIDGYLATIEAIKEEEVTAANFDTDTSEYERAIQEEQQFVESLKEQESSIESQIEEKRPEVDDLKRRINEVDIRNEKVLRDIATAEQDLADFVQNLTQRQEKLEKKREKIRQFEAIIEKRDDEIQDIKATIGEYLQTAKKLAAQRLALEKEQAENFDSKSQKLTEEDLEAIEIPQLDSIKPPKHFETRVQRMKSKIQEEEERRSASEVDPLEVQEKYERAKQVLESKMQQIREIDETCKDLKDDHTARKQRWKQFREHIGFSTDRGFDEILNKKGSAGTIEFDHKNKNLNLCVQKDSADTNSQQKDVKALSGGERSFTTIALLLALGESLETPFRVLDEFDVFLDPVTRKLTIDSLINMATSDLMKHRQFIFITPQDVSNVKVDDMLKVFKMTPPTRRDVAGGAVQQTLDFSQE